MKKRTLIIAVALLALLLTVPAPAFAYGDYDSSLVLENKDPGDWEVIKGDGVKGKLDYNSAGEDFSYSLFAKGLEGETDYSLIYFADPWPGDNPGALIHEGTTNAKGKLKNKHNTGEVDLGMSLPHPDDANYLDGAKIWLVPSADYNGGALTAWNPGDYLFEYNLITYDRVVPTSDAYDRYKGLSGVFWVEVLNYSGFDTYKWDDWSSVDRVLRDDVVVSNKTNGLICTLYIPEGTHLSYPGRPSTLVTNLSVEKDDSGGVYFEPGNMDFSQPCALACVTDGVEEVITFTQIRDGLPVPMVEVVPASSVASPAWIYGT